MGSWNSTPNVRVTVTPKIGVPWTARLDEVAEKLGTTEATVRSWCTGMSNCPYGYEVRYTDIRGKGKDTRTPNERRQQIKQAKANYQRMVERRKEIYGDDHTSLYD